MSGFPSAPPPAYNDVYGSDPNRGGMYPPQNAAFPPPMAAAGLSGNYNTQYSNPTSYTGPGYKPDGYDNPPPAQQPPFMPPPMPRIGPKPEETAINDTFLSAGSFSDRAIRRAFIRKVYLILLAQLLVTVGFICLFMYLDPVRNWIQGPGRWFYFVSYGTFLVTYITLICIPSVRRKTPGNYICLAVFTLAFSYMTGTIASYYDTNIVLIAAGITAAVCLAISLFAIQTKIDFTMCSGLLFVLCIVVILFGFATMIVYFTIGYNRILDCVYAGLAALLFGLFLVYDTQMIVGGRKHEMSPEEYIYGSLQLYLDVVYLFLIILSLFGKSN